MKKSVLVVSLFMLVALFAVPSFAFEVISASYAYELATTDDDTFILDVRQGTEWKWVAHPGPDGTGYGAGLVIEGEDGEEDIWKVVNIPIMIEKKGKMTLNRSFLSDVNEHFEGQDVTLITMCRSGFRGGVAAAMLKDAGYDVMNMKHGFEGDAEKPSGYRRTVNGWIVDGLPFTYVGAGYKD
ncbi:MAG TPA: hypothetical protein DCO77_06415 [Nitrospiraceae bacterium]|nr:hypothetical protein [Nitrospiraceae bacterium]